MKGGPQPGAGRPPRVKGERAVKRSGPSLTEREHARLAALAERWGCSIAEAQRRAIEMACDREEDPVRAILDALSRLSPAQVGAVRVVVKSMR